MKSSQTGEKNDSLLASITTAYALRVKAKVSENAGARLRETTEENVEKYVALCKGVLEGKVTMENLKTYR